ncbi:MAG: ribosome biogenesis GTP-binding protein YihA/YsxC [Bacteroidota bacterium]
MNIGDASYVISSPSVEKCPEPKLPEYAFIGRSNVGKSSLINLITGRKELARTSAKPGKTQLINHYLINSSWYLVDLPGYGYAKISWTERVRWQKMIRDYLIKRTSLMSVFVLVDIRIDPQASDLEFINWLGGNRIPFGIVFTKCDKISRQQSVKAVEKYKRKLLETWEDVPPLFITSATDKIGRDELIRYIAESNLAFERPGQHP